AGFADPQLGRALAAMHEDPARDWTVVELARVAGLSRSGFSERFGRMVGMSPIAYLTRWRLQVARDALATRGVTVGEAARLAGYGSEAAFSRAFKAELGAAPSRFRAR
ncbi:MAG: AraC family transcriptional regulator, partial [Pseudomonadota bacterium]